MLSFQQAEASVFGVQGEFKVRFKRLTFMLLFSLCQFRRQIQSIASVGLMWKAYSYPPLSNLPLSAGSVDSLPDA